MRSWLGKGRKIGSIDDEISRWKAIRGWNERDSGLAACMTLKAAHRSTYSKMWLNNKQSVSTWKWIEFLILVWRSRVSAWNFNCLFRRNHPFRWHHRCHVRKTETELRHINLIIQHHVVYDLKQLWLNEKKMCAEWGGDHQELTLLTYMRKRGKRARDRTWISLTPPAAGRRWWNGLIRINFHHPVWKGARRDEIHEILKRSREFN